MKTLIINPELSKAIVTALNECKNPYAQTYLKALPLSASEGEALGVTAEEGVRTQLLYVISNMAGWRGDTARETKKILKKYSSGKEKIFITAGDARLN